MLLQGKHRLTLTAKREYAREYRKRKKEEQPEAAVTEIIAAPPKPAA